VDRIFRTVEDVRWIVDYKTSPHEGADREAFLDREQGRYRAQLEAYAHALAPGEAMLGLYFPVLAAWKQWRSDAG
jgi:ATP-dependent exoDNAse (exonuclease V) beta subunit